MRTGAGRDGLARVTLDDEFLTCSIIRTLSKVAVGGSFSLLGPLGAIFWLAKMHVGRYNIFTRIPPLSARRGRREWMDGTRWIWMMFPFWVIFYYLISDNSSCLLSLRTRGNYNKKMYLTKEGLSLVLLLRTGGK
jgi:hypothetical protein